MDVMWSTTEPRLSRRHGNHNGWTWPQDWTVRLRELAGQALSGTQIAAILSQEFRRTFTRNAILGRANRTGIQLNSRPGYRWRPKARNHWTKEEDATLRAMVMDGIGIADCAEVLERGYHAARTRCQHLGLKPRQYHRRAAKEIRPRGDRGPSLMRDIPTEYTATETNLVNLSLFQCRWPTRDQFYCGAIVDPNIYPHAYCRAHCERAYRGTAK